MSEWVKSVDVGERNRVAEHKGKEKYENSDTAVSKEVKIDENCD